MRYGLLLLRSTPMLLSTAAVNYSYNQYLFYRPFVDIVKDLPHDNVNTALSHYVRHVFPPGFAAILVLYPLSWAATTANLLTSSWPLFRSWASTLPPLTRKSRYLYIAGLCFNVGHMLWGPRALDLLETIGRLGAKEQDRRAATRLTEAEKDLDNVDLMKIWLRMHITRSVLADVPSWLCFSAAFFTVVKKCI